MSKKTKVLVIDDEVSLEKIYKTFLNKLGAEVEFFDHPQKGWKAIDLTVYDLIITDLKMPIITGDEFISIVRGSRLNAHTPIILSSAHIDRPVMAELSRQSKVYFLNKPFDSQKLNELFTKVLGVKGKGQKSGHEMLESWKSQFEKQLMSHKIEIDSILEFEAIDPWNVESVLAQYTVFEEGESLNLALLMKSKTFLDLAGSWQGTHYSDLEAESFLIWDQLLSKCFKNCGRVLYSKVIGHQFMTLTSEKKPIIVFKTEYGDIQLSFI